MPRNWAPSSPIRMHHAYWREYIAISMRNGHALSCTPQSLLLLFVSYPNLFPRHIGLTRNNSKCFFIGPVFLLRTEGKGTKSFGFTSKNQTKRIKSAIFYHFNCISFNILAFYCYLCTPKLINL